MTTLTRKLLEICYLRERSLALLLQIHNTVVTLPRFLSAKSIPTRTEQVLFGHSTHYGATLTFCVHGFLCICSVVCSMPMVWRLVCAVYSMAEWCAVLLWCTLWLCGVKYGSGVQCYCGVHMTVWCVVWLCGVVRSMAGVCSVTILWCTVHYDCMVCIITAWCGERLCGVVCSIALWCAVWLHGVVRDCVVWCAVLPCGVAVWLHNMVRDRVVCRLTAWCGERPCGVVCSITLWCAVWLHDVVRDRVMCRLNAWCGERLSSVHYYHVVRSMIVLCGVWLLYPFCKLHFCLSKL